MDRDRLRQEIKYQYILHTHYKGGYTESESVVKTCSRNLFAFLVNFTAFRRACIILLGFSPLLGFLLFPWSLVGSSISFSNGRAGTSSFNGSWRLLCSPRDSCSAFSRFFRSNDSSCCNRRVFCFSSAITQRELAFKWHV